MKLSIVVLVDPKESIAILEKAFISFRTVADELVVGVDSKAPSTLLTFVKKYSNVIVLLNTDVVDLSCYRNQCIEKCTGDWILLVSGYEKIVAGNLLHNLTEQHSINLYL